MLIANYVLVSVDQEVTDVCSKKPPAPCLRRPATSQTPASRPEPRLFTTKRSETPLGVVSDADSDSESPRAQPSSGKGLKGDTPSPRPSTASYFASTVNYLTKPRWPKLSPRTCTSLDNVDLWESDEESEQGGGSQQGFDKINGVAINPSKTIDFSELHSEIRRSRSPVACKRNKLDKNCVPTSNQNHREQRLDRLVRDPRIKPKGKSTPKPGLLPDLPKSRAEPAKHESHKDTDRVPRELKASIDERKMANILRQVNTPPGSKGRDISNQKVAKFSKNAAIANLTHQPSPPPTRPVHPTPPSPMAPTPPTTYKSSPSEFALMRMRNNNRSPDPVNREMDIGDNKDSPNTRKVKFQNFVTVREGEENTTEDLRMSNNSAQQYKQMYLGGGADLRPTPPPALPPYNPANYEDSEDSMDQSTWRLEIVC